MAASQILLSERQAEPSSGLPASLVRRQPALEHRWRIVLVYKLGVQCRIVKRAMHGTKLMSWSEVRETYGRELVNLRNEGRYTFLNTLFSVSEAVLYMQACTLSSVGCQSPAWQASPLCTAVAEGCALAPASDALGT